MRKRHTEPEDSRCPGRLEQLSEDRPGEIEDWCRRMCSGTAEEAAQMVPRVTHLDYNKLDDEVIEAVEGALFYAMTGEHRRDRQQAGE